MSRVALGALLAGGFTWFAARLAAAQFVDEEADRHGWTSAAGHSLWASGREAPARSPLVVELPQPRHAQVYSAA